MTIQRSIPALAVLAAVLAAVLLPGLHSLSIHRCDDDLCRAEHHCDCDHDCDGDEHEQEPRESGEHRPGDCPLCELIDLIPAGAAPRLAAAQVWWTPVPRSTAGVTDWRAPDLRIARTHPARGPPA